MTSEADRGVAESTAENTATMQRLAAARASISEFPADDPGPSFWTRLLENVRGTETGDHTTAREPLAAISFVRMVVAALLAALCVLTVGGAVLMLLLWQQDRESGVLTSQLDRTWELLGHLQTVERVLAFAVVPVAMAWIVLAAVNVRRATGRHRSAITASLSLPVSLFGVWYAGQRFVDGVDEPLTQAIGWVLQVAALALPVIFLERIAIAGDARRRPLRAGYLIGALYLAQLQFLAGLSTIERADATDKWGEYGAYLLIGALIQVLGALALNEAARSIEDGTQHRFQLRSRFSESLLAQAALA